MSRYNNREIMPTKVTTVIKRLFSRGADLCRSFTIRRAVKGWPMEMISTLWSRKTIYMDNLANKLQEICENP